MTILATAENLAAIQAAIIKLANGERTVKVEHTSASGSKRSVQYSEVSLPELRDLEYSMRRELNPIPLMQNVEVEVVL
ncbi:hypothetical protein GCM10007938_43090 [Vibrio zhanjiangensis]|uniref:Uncharacterized protein n=1 Tax=Vibrio zhanjiangensis TaxID=1046128 RepID=A0ABQ6F6B1_9VIBR|nr:hypothetical protein [Vibrio zhanjiangensis]GLT20524.1 hypothetical protein GCM10007938_43090 [Vibrio zhanjiangensis]